jgi:hypothetical protein
MQRKKLFNNIGKLTDTNCTIINLNYIDQLFLNIRLHAEHKMKKHYKDWWHNDLKVWKDKLKQLNKNLKKIKQQHLKSHKIITKVLTKRQKIKNISRAYTTQFSNTT